MARTERARRDVGAVTVKRLRKKLRRAEAQLTKAQAKRDRAQARVEALGIIADEIRATMAEVERADAAALRVERAERAEAATAAASADAPVERSADAGQAPAGGGDGGGTMSPPGRGPRRRATRSG